MTKRIDRPSRRTPPMPIPPEWLAAYAERTGQTEVTRKVRAAYRQFCWGQRQRPK